MKLIPDPSIKDPCPLFVDNVGTHGGTRLSKSVFSKHIEIVLNGRLLHGRQHYGITTSPSLSPVPLQGPIGAEALSVHSELARKAANQAVRDELLKPVPDPEVLRIYSGGGGLGESFCEYYTPEMVAQAMYAAAGTIKTSAKFPVSILDPACGPGTLLARAPENARLIGVELERTSSAVAQALLPHASIVNQPFEAFQRGCSDPLYDYVLLNPPFGPRPMRHVDQKHIALSEHYFVLSSLMRVKYQRGIVVALVNLNLSGGDSHKRWRHNVARFGQVLHTVAVPEGAFRAAGAGVSTVMLTIRRHDAGVTEALSVLDDQQLSEVLGDYAGVSVSGFLAGEAVYRSEELKAHNGEIKIKYTLKNVHQSEFTLGADDKMVLGNFNQPSYPAKLKVDDVRLNGIRAAVDRQLGGTAVTLSSVIGSIEAHYGKALREEAQHAARLGTERASACGIALGTRSDDGTWVMSMNGWIPSDDFARPEVADALQLAGTLGSYLEAVRNQQDASRLRRVLDVQAAQYRAAHQTFDRARLLRLSARFSNLALLLTHLDAEDKLITPPAPVRALNITGQTPEEIARQLGDLMMLTQESLMDHAGITETQAQALLLAHYCFTGEIWVAPGLYYHGNAILKSQQARVDAKLHSGVRALALSRQSESFLERMTAVSLEDVRISPRDPVVPDVILEAWVNTFLNCVSRSGKHTLIVTRTKGAVNFIVRVTQKNQNVIQSRKAFDERAARDLQKYLNHHTRMASIDGAGEMSKEEYRAERAAAMEEAREYELRVAASFQSWLPSSGFADQMMQAYNQARNAHLRPQGLTDPLPLADWKGPGLHPYQSMDVRTMATSNGMICGYDVGLGKTFTGLALVAYLKLLALSLRPAVVVPSGLVSNWALNAALALPSWRIVSVGMSAARNPDGTPKFKTKRDGSVMTDERGNPVPLWTEDNTATKRLKLAQIAAGQADLVIMSRDAFTSLPMTDENREHFISTDLQYIKRMESQETFEGRNRRSRNDVLKRLIAFRSSCQARLKQSSDNDLKFEALGLDFIMYDEAQSYKNLYSAPTAFGVTPKFLGAGTESNRALDAVHKGRYVRARGGRTFAMTASWVKNSPLEVHSMISLISDDLPEYGLATNEVLMEQYLEIEPRIITTLEGDVDVRPAVVGFQRLKELKGIIDSKVIIRAPGDPEVITRDGKLLHSPKIVEEEVTFSMTPEQLNRYEQLREQAKDATAASTGENHTFSIAWKMRKVSADPALLNLSGENPRFLEAARQALSVRAEGGKSLVFLSIGEKEGSFSRLKQILVDAGYPAHEIAIVSSSTHKGSVARQDLEDQYNHGDLTLVIGSEMLSEGFNLQRGTRAIIHCDIPWNFEGIRQRNGRGGRQGNTYAEVKSIYLLMKGSFDTITYTIMRGKQSWMRQLDGTTDRTANSAAEFGADEMAMLLSDNPETTRIMIAAKKEDLQERSGRAGFRRRLETLFRTWSARQSLQKTIQTANERKKGWTAFDHLRVHSAQRSFEHHHRELEDTALFPLNALVTYKAPLNWEYGLPFHEGLSFVLGEVHYEVDTFDPNLAKCRNFTPGHAQYNTIQTLSVRDIARNAKDFKPNPKPEAYDTRAANTGMQVLRLTMPSNVPIKCLHGQKVNPVPKAEGVISISVAGNVVEAISGADTHTLRRHLSLGRTVVHYLNTENKEGLTITSIVVLCPNQTMLEQTRKLERQPKFIQRLHDIAEHALSA